MTEDVRIKHCENVEALHELDATGERFALAYLDPPFFTGRNFKTAEGETAYSDKWQSFDEYLDALSLRVQLAYQLLTDTGTIVIHVDPTVSHYVKVRGDELFGRERFVNEIIWKRTLPKGLATERLSNDHDVLLVFSKGGKWTWNGGATLVPYNLDDIDEKTANQYSKVDENGRRYQLTSLLNPNTDRPNLTYEFLGVRRVWRWTKQRMEAAHKAGLVVQAKPGSVPRFKRYLDEQRGRALGDVWVDIPPVLDGRERTGYPTQKPEALYKRLVLVLTNQGDAVLDPYCGSGTMPAVCHQLGRRCVGIDQSEVAVRYANDRLSAIAVSLAG